MTTVVIDIRRFMDEGLDNDDKYRMVEDEFLAVAQQFTAHLHAAEYKRQEKMAKSRNAQTIQSISRPVVGKMPDQTKRKANGVELAKKQSKSLATLLGKGGKDRQDSDSDDGDGLPYLGTTLHGLMDSPRRKAVSLRTMAPAAKTTRSAAGFKKPAGTSNPASIYSPPSKKSDNNLSLAKPEHDGSTETSDDDYDLDAPVPAPKLTKTEPHSSFYSSSSTNSATRPSQVTSTKATIPSTKPISFLSRTIVKQEGEPQLTLNPTQKGRDMGDSIPRVSRVERARRMKEQNEKGKTTTKKLDIIPSFL
jgi:hypothetical protein